MESSARPALVFDAALLKKYDIAGPRYTSYPTALQFREHFGEDDYRRQALLSAQWRTRQAQPLSLYFHIPFCATVCFYCGCNKIITANRGRAAPYLERMRQELALQAALFDDQRPVGQLHWGGGTPTFIDEGQMASLMNATSRHFCLLDDDTGEYSIEIDPREVDAARIRALRALGFNRLSIGVQDIDPAVQRAVNRVQPPEVTETALRAARQAGFRSIGMDLIYGLPKQSVASFDATLDAVIAMDPDRLSVFNYAHLPALFKVQRQIDENDLPAAAEKLAILQHTIRRLTAAGYVYIGMDHFAKPEDELARAQRGGRLHRNFQGYSTHAGSDLIGIGMTAIGQVGNSYSQNAKTPDTYYAAIDGQRLPILRGLVLSADDNLRRAVITRLICHFTLDIVSLEREFGIGFASYFAAELKALQQMRDDGLVRIGEDRIDVLPPGRLLVRNICMAFDRYLDLPEPRRFSRAI